MKLDPHSTASAVRSRRLLFALVCLPVLFALAEPPAWWTERQVLDPSAAKNDYGPANQGQLKNIATKAYAELQAKLPASAWNTPEGQALGVLVTSWDPAQGDNYAPINQGQLKAVAKKFYDVLIQAGYTPAYPWTTTTTDDTSYAPANIGQVKNMFAFELGSNTSDSDGNGLPDNWEIANFGHIGVNPNALAARGDGLTILQAFQQGLDPNDYYNGQTPFPVLRARSGGASKRKCGFEPFNDSRPDTTTPGNWVSYTSGCGDPGELYDRRVNTGDPVADGARFLTLDTYTDGGQSSCANCTDCCAASGSSSYHIDYDSDECHADFVSEIFTGEVTADDPECSDGHGNQPLCISGGATLSNEYTTDQLVAQTRAAMSPIPDLDSPPDPSEEVGFATFQMDPDQSSVYITQSNYQFKWYQSPNLPQDKKITWLEIFYPADDPRTTEIEDTTPVTTVRSWEGTADRTDTYYLSPTVQGRYQIVPSSVELTQLNYPTSADTTDLGPTAEKSISEDAVAYITSVPEMPRLEASLGGGSVSDMTVEWRLEVKTERSERGTKDDFKIPTTGVIEKSIGEPWNIYENYIAPNDFFGGNVTVFFRIKKADGSYLMPAEQTMTFKIRGKNPKDADAKTYIQSTEGDYRFAWAMVQHESRQTPSGGGTDRVYNQFNSGGATKELPNYGAPDGWGIAQLDKPLNVSASTSEVYSWNNNVTKFYAELGEKQGFADAYFNALRSIYQPQGQWEEPPSDFVRQGTVTHMSALEAAVTVLYNGASWAVDISNGSIIYSGSPSVPKRGGTRYLSCWQFHPDSPSGSKWEFHENSTNPQYLFAVIYTEFEPGHETHQE